MRLVFVCGDGRGCYCRVGVARGVCGVCVLWCVCAFDACAVFVVWSMVCAVCVVRVTCVWIGVCGVCVVVWCLWRVFSECNCDLWRVVCLCVVCMRCVLLVCFCVVCVV